MSQNRCYVMVGAIGAGKTTYAKELAQLEALVYLSPDDFWDRSRVDEYSDQIQIDVWGSIYSQMYQLIKQRRDFVLDSAQVRRSSRREVTGVIRSIAGDDYRLAAILVQCDLERCLARVRSRGEFVPEERIQAYYKVLMEEPPSLDDGYDEIILVQG